MRTQNARLLTFLFFLLGGETVFAQLYSVTDLGTLLGGEGDSQAYAVNSHGTVAGASTGTADGGYTGCGGVRATKPFVWTATTGMQVLGPPPTLNIFASPLFPCGGRALGINDQGMVVGYLDYGYAGGGRAFVWTATGGMQLIGDPSGYVLGPGLATAVNNAGQVVGSAGASAYRWSVAGGFESRGVAVWNTAAYAINNKGEIAGVVAAGSWAPVFWTDAGEVQYIDGLPYTGGQNYPSSINDNGQIVGRTWGDSSSIIFGEHKIYAFFWSQSTGALNMGELPVDPLPNGQSFSEAYGINDSGVVVGMSNGRAFVWAQGTTIRDLNSVTDSSGAGWTLISANAVNDAGQIVGDGTYNGQNRAFLMAPVATSGTISVTTNLPTATFSITGASSYSGAGTSFSSSAPAGIYTITFGSVAGFSTPLPQTFALTSGNSISFSGSYKPFLLVGPQTLSFQYKPGTKDPIPAQTLVVSSSAGSLPFTVTITTNPPGGNWIVSSKNGMATPAGVNIPVTVSPGLPGGAYFATSLVSAVDAANQAVSVPISLVVSATTTKPVGGQTATLTVTTNLPDHGTFTIKDDTGKVVPDAINVGSFTGGLHAGTYSVEYNQVSGYYTPPKQSVTLTKPGIVVPKQGIYRRLLVVSFTGWNNAPDPSNCIPTIFHPIKYVGSGYQYAIGDLPDTGIVTLLSKIQTQYPDLAKAAYMAAFTFYATDSAQSNACTTASDSPHLEAGNWFTLQHATQDDVVVVIGHSYGGNRAVRFVDQLKGMGYAVDLLAAIDPIDWDVCDETLWLSGPFLNGIQFCDQSDLTYVHSAKAALSFHQTLGTLVTAFPKGYILSHSTVYDMPDFHTTIDDDGTVHAAIINEILFSVAKRQNE